MLWSTLHSMETIQVVLEEDLLRAADRAARRLKVNRSALLREALRTHLAALARRQRERADRAGYERQPDRAGSDAVWERVAAWPEV
jgi:predicted transcriptional regulator